MPITQDRMIRLLNDAQAAMTQVKFLTEIAKSYRTDRRLKEARTLAFTGSAVAAQAQTEEILFNLIDRICEERLPRKAELNLLLEQNHFERRQKYNDDQRRRNALRRGPSRRRLPQGPNPNLGLSLRTEADLNAELNEMLTKNELE